MATPLLSTKLYIPPARVDIVSRSRLVEKLFMGVNQPGGFLLLSGPAGFGKTTLLNEFVGRYQKPIAWVSLDEGDNDPARFWTYLISACQTVLAGVGESALALFGSPQPPPPEAVPIILINDLDRLDGDLVLVLDDYHVIQNESIHSALLFLLEHLPIKLHLIISTRVDPPWPLARFRARNQLVEIRAHDLRFSMDEAAEFLNHTMGLILSVEDIAALEARTEGWIAGLQLAALSMQRRSDLASFVKNFTGSHIYVAEYLVEEVLRRQPEELQSFLLQTSILERLSAGLCEAVTGCQGIQDILTVLHKANLFVIPLDDENRWFRYHHLFSDLLQMRLQQVHNPQAIVELHRRAATWYEQNGYLNEAISHSITISDYDRIGRLVEQNADQMLTRGELVTLLRWIEGLPTEMISLHPQILITKIWVLTLAGAIHQVEPFLQVAEAQIEVYGETPISRELSGFAAAIRAFLAMLGGDDLRALQLARRAELLLPEHSIHARWLIPYTLGAAYRGQGQYDQAVDAFARQARMGEENDNLIAWGTGVTGIALARRAQGRLREVNQVCRQALERLAKRGAAEFGSLAKLETPLIEVLIEQNELEEAEQRLAGVMRRLQTWPLPTDQIHADLAQIQLQEAQADLPGAFETLRIAKDLKASHPVLMNLARSVDLDEIRLFLKSGDIMTADRLMNTLQPGTSRWLELRDQEYLLLARLRLAQEKPDEAGRILSPLANDAEAGERKATLIETLALQALVLFAQGEKGKASAVLSKGLALAEPEGFVRVFVDAGERMRILLAEAALQLEKTSDQDSQPSQAYVTRLLEAYPAQPSLDAPPPASNQFAGLVEQLSPRELVVLQLIAAGDSNRTIAGKLFITLSAVKKHTANIYGKLGVNSRTQAIARARQLYILPSDQ